MIPNLQEQLDKINAFKEDESYKVQSIKKLCSSKLFLTLIIFTIAYTAFYFVISLINGITTLELIDFNNVFSILVDQLLASIFPGLFIYFIISIYNSCKKETYKSPRLSPLNRLSSLRRYAKFFYIISIIGFIANGITYLNIDYFNEIMTEHMGEAFILDTTYTQIIGVHNIILACLYSGCWFALSRLTKIAISSILLDTNDNKYYDVFIFIGLVIVIPVIQSVGCILSLFGIQTFLTPIIFVENIVYTDILYVIYAFMGIGLSVLISILLLKFRKILITISGSSNPLMDEVVYTVNID